MTTQTEQTIGDLTISEFRTLVQEIVAEAIEELVRDPDEGLELREEFIQRLEQSIAEASAGKTTPADEVYRRLGLG